MLGVQRAAAPTPAQVSRHARAIEGAVAVLAVCRSLVHDHVRGVAAGSVRRASAMSGTAQLVRVASACERAKRPRLILVWDSSLSLRSPRSSSRVAEGHRSPRRATDAGVTVSSVDRDACLPTAREAFVVVTRRG